MARRVFSKFYTDTFGNLPSGWTNVDSGDFKVRATSPVSGSETLGDPTFHSLGIALNTGLASAVDGSIQFAQKVVLDGANNGVFCSPIFAAADGQTGLL